MTFFWSEADRRLIRHAAGFMRQTLEAAGRAGRLGGSGHGAPDGWLPDGSRIPRRAWSTPMDAAGNRQRVSNWLNTIISNVVRNELRRLSRCRFVYTPAAEDPVPWGRHHPIDVPSFNRAPDEDIYITEVGCAAER